MSDYLEGLQGRRFPYDVKVTADHWWPKGLQRLWADPCGYVSRVKPCGNVKTTKASTSNSSKKGFAHKLGGHRIHLGPSPWNHTFEPEFSAIDNAAPDILRRLQRNLEVADLNPDWIKKNTSTTTETLIKLCFSLLIRSPAFRHHYSSAGKAFNMPYNPEIGKLNISHFWRCASKIDLLKCNFGTLSLLYSNRAEFCFGDGLCDTIFYEPIRWRNWKGDYVADLLGDAFLPLLPNVCAHLYFERNGCGSTTRLVNVSNDIVKYINSLTQVYAKEQLFFRSVWPDLSVDFLRNEHMIFQSQNIPSIEEFRATINKNYVKLQ